MKKELLIPAGNMECLHAAVHNGADAVYVGLKEFGARKYAANFTLEEMSEAVMFCHLYGVKLYVTLNTLIKDDETEAFLDTVEKLVEIGVDALIMQDFGMICYVRECFPDIEIHASTQFNNSNEETLALLEKIGVKRVVLSRELSLEEITKMKTPLEKEVFIHGALCISYSGNCYMSSALGSRSGNKGACTGCCRLPFSLFFEKEKQDSGYLLSTKELNTSSMIKDLMDSDIVSFKVEGRMKGVEYVSFITKFYRDLMNKKEINLEERLEQLNVIFNREFTTGHLFSAKELMNTKTPNHLGLHLGKVIGITNKLIKIKLDRDLHQEDAIRFKESNKGFVVNFLYDEKEKLINRAKAGDIVYLDNKIELSTHDTLAKTKDKHLSESLISYPFKKIPIKMSLTARVDELLTLNITDKEYTVTVKGPVVTKALNAPIENDRIKKQLEKLGETPFISEETIINTDEDKFISIKELNSLRRDAVEKLVVKRTDKNRSLRKESMDFPVLDVALTKETTCTLYTEEQLVSALTTNIDKIFVDEKLYERFKDNPRVFLKKSSNTDHKTIDGSLVSEYLVFSNHKNLRGNYTLNVTNIYSLYYLLKYGLTTVMLSIELTEEEQHSLIKRFITTFGFTPNVELLGYAKIENMIIKGNVFNIQKNKFGYNISNPKEEEFDVYFDGVNTRVLNHQKTKLVDPYLASFNIRLDFYDEKGKQVNEEINKILGKISELC